MCRMKVAIYGQTYQGQDTEAVFGLLDELKKVGAQVAVEHDFGVFLSQSRALEEYGSFDLHHGLAPDFDMFVSFGGDGTMLRAVTYVRDMDIPIVGVNTGRLGFLSTFSKEEVQKVVTEFLKGAFTIEERSLVQLELEGNDDAFGELNFALNEIAISRKDTTSMITVETYLDDEYLTSYWADGLIVSTPTGSTGYSLSCGGPVIAPTTKSFVITPIAPHNLNARPLVIPDDTELKMKVSGREEHHLISLDSRIVTIPNGTQIKVKKADFSIKLIEYKSESFLKTIRKKLLWGHDKRN